jgi:hypothetical protein
VQLHSIRIEELRSGPEKALCLKPGGTNVINKGRKSRLLLSFSR